MNVIINDQEKEVNGKTVDDVMREMKLDRRKIVVELNKVIIKKEEFAQQKIQDHDRIEIVTIVGGG